MGSERQSLSVAEALELARQRGLIAAEGRPVGAALGAAAPVPKRVKPPLVPASFAPLPAPTWTVPLYVTPGDNERGTKKKIGRAGHERRVVARHLAGATLRHLVPFAEAAARGETVTVSLTRLGGTGLDPFDGLPASLKYCVDAVCLLMGCSDDAKSPVKFVSSQEPGSLHGVRITLRVGA